MTFGLSQGETTPPAVRLRPLRLQEELARHLRTAEPELWRWFASAEASEHEEEVRRELLKTTYRLEPEAHAEAYAAAERARVALDVDAPVTLYQAQSDGPFNASVLSLGSVVHVVFFGTILSALSRRELDAVLAHEIAHHALRSVDGGDLFTAERMLTAFANDPRARDAHLHSDRRFALATEIVADRAAAHAADDLEAAVGALVKMTTRLASVDAASYLRQADEVFAGGEVVAEGVTHPKPFIRARALRLWVEQGEGCEDEVETMIAGPLDLDALDLTGQARVTELTRELVAAFLS